MRHGSKAASPDLGTVGALDAVAAPPAWEPARHDAVQQRLSEEVRNLVLVSEVGQVFTRQQGNGGESGLLEAMTRSARILFDFENAVVLLENLGYAVDMREVPAIDLPGLLGGRHLLGAGPGGPAGSAVFSTDKYTVVG